VKTLALVTAAASVLCSVACSSLLPTSLPAPSLAATDPTPLAKCKISSSAQSPLVTEWPASEKAHLESLASSQTIAVEYVGCELSIVDGCALTGSYVWQRTTLATDTIDVANADELFAKLPVGAVGLEAELERSGKLAVRTTVAGQLRAKGVDPAAADITSCARATHYVAAVSVGAFQLLSGSDAAASGSVSALSAKGGAKASRKQVVLREAGSREACADTTDAAPSRQCASPIQLFLAPLRPKTRADTSRTAEDAMRATGVQIAFPPPHDADETWTVRGPGGKIVCTVPCQTWVGPVSGYYLMREPRGHDPSAKLDLPQAFAHPVGTRVIAEYQTERGNPMLSRWTFYGAIPVGVTGAGLTAWGVVQATKSCNDEPGGKCFPDGGFLIGAGVLWMAMSGAATWWYLWSREERFTTREDLSVSRKGTSLFVVPTGVAGTF
jgi:hypothetical protein